MSTAQKLCPLMTTFQVVPRQFQIPKLELNVVPVGETKVAPVDQLMAQGKRPASMGGLDLSAIGKTVTVFQAQGQVSGWLGYKTPEGTKQDDPDPPLAAESLEIPCQEARCAFWCDRQKDCRQVAPCDPGCTHQQHEGPDEGQGDEG
jgi:hypothetical protein